MPRHSSREKLLDCAEGLFAERGLEGVSLRTVNAEAGLSPAALHYHFGSQQALVEALLERRMPSLMERRRQLLDDLDAKNSTASARDVLDALMRPLAELLAEGGDAGLRYLRLIHRLQADGDLDPQFVIDRWPGGVERMVPLLQRALPDLPLALVQLRLGLAIDVMLRSLALGTSATSHLDAHVTALLDFLTGALEAPVTGDFPA
ncbi:MAG: TetR/AcrR family transcriptional regulator [Deltaproteobacteria bacterium]|nr:TetR/AcrR family transcriptional regulator [Deltaproteobacteria bacterium]